MKKVKSIKKRNYPKALTGMEIPLIMNVLSSIMGKGKGGSESGSPMEGLTDPLSKIGKNLKSIVYPLTGISTLFSNAQTAQDENRRYIESIQPKPQFNTNEGGVNNTPAYFGEGGRTKYQLGALAGVAAGAGATSGAGAAAGLAGLPDLLGNMGGGQPGGKPKEEPLNLSMIGDDPVIKELLKFLQMQQGGQIDPLFEQRKFFNEYINSPNYKNRLKTQGYANPDQTIKDRRGKLNSMGFVEIPGNGSEYNKYKNTVLYDPLEVKKYGDKPSTVKTHEVSHGVGAMGNHLYKEDKINNLTLNLNEIKELNRRNKNFGIDHDGRANELKADIDALRFQLYKDKIYNTGNQKFDKNFLKQAKEKYRTDPYIKRVFERLNDDDLIYLMNNIAHQNNSKNNTFYAQTGGTPNTDLRNEWNTYVDWLAGQGMKGKPELDKDSTGFKYLEQYRQLNPKTPLTKEAIPEIQSYLQNYRTWVIDNHKSGKRPIKFAADPGANYEAFMPNLSKVDGYPGQYTTSYKFPLEYLNSVQQGFADMVKQKQEGGYVENDILELDPNKIKELQKLGYEFEFVED